MSELVKTTQTIPSTIDRDKVRRLVRQGAGVPLSHERETAPFLLYLAGDSLDEIAFKQQIPRDIIEITAVHYKWDERRIAFTASGLNLPQELQKRIANTLLITTYAAIQQELADVASHKKEAKDCMFIPKSIGALKQLTEFVNEANQLMPQDPNKPAQAMPGVAVQVNVQQNGESVVQIQKIDPEEKAKMLREQAAKKKQ